MFPLDQHTVFLTLAGSRAHGTARADSDVDLRGVCVAPLAVRVSLFRSFEQYEGEMPQTLATAVIPRLEAHPTAALGLTIKTECVIFDVAKFVGLCAGANPNALEILFADERDWVFETPAWRRLHAARHTFLTKKVGQTFHGYALAQLKKIRTHRSWLLNPPAEKPSRAEFGASPKPTTLTSDDRNRIEQSIAERVRGYGVDTVELPKAARIAVHERLEAFYADVLEASAQDIPQRLREVASQALQLPSEVVAALNAEKKYQAALKHWEAYQAWKEHRNPLRAELERKHGYDTKHAMHLIRLMRMGIEALASGELRVKRDDASELAAIRDGARSFDDLLAEASALTVAMADAAATTTLPDDVDREAADMLLAAALGIE